MARKHRRKSKRISPHRGENVPRTSFIKRIPKHVIRQVASALLWIITITTVVVGWNYGMPQLQAVAADARFSSDIKIKFENAPAWFNSELADTISLTALIQLSGNPFERDELIAIHDVLMQTGWFDEVRQVRRVREDIVSIDASFVRPFAVVRDADGEHLVDGFSKLLPKTYAVGSNTPFVTIIGARYDRPPGAGKIWEGSDIAAAIELLRFLINQRWRDQIAQIDVSEYLRKTTLKLTTTFDSTVVWGAAPGEEQPLEALAKSKLERLNYLYENHARIDGGHSGQVDITDQTVVVTR